MSKKILIVDDEKAIVDILDHNLKREGYETVQAYDGEEAIETIKNEKPDLILLDVMLPKMDGLSICKTVRQTSNIPIIMVTANEDVVDKVIGLELGADDYITKPFSVREVVARVKANLRKWDEIETTKKGVALIYLLQQTYGSKMYPNFGNYSFHGYYTDKECTKELDLYTQLHEDMTIYPKLKEDTTKCDLMFSISNVLFLY